MNWRRILLINLINRHQRFDSYARHPTLKDMDYQFTFFRFVNNRCTAEDQTLSTYIILHYLKPLMPYRSLYYTNELPPFTYTQMPSKLIVKLTLHQNRQQKHSTQRFSKINEKYLVVRYGPWQKITHKFSDINIILLDTLTQKCPNFIRTIGRHLDDLIQWIVRMGNTGVWSMTQAYAKENNP